MDTPRAASARRRRNGILGLLTVLAVGVTLLAVTPYLTTSLERLAADGGGLAAGYVGRPTVVIAAFYLHVVAGGIALVLTPWQLWPGLRRRRPGAHRLVGRATVGAVTVAAGAGLVIAPFNQAGPVGVVGFGALGVLWAWTTWRGLAAARRRDLPAHRDWMTRAVALTFAAVTLRLWTAVLVVALTAWDPAVDPEAAFSRAYAVVPFLCWVPNLVLAEVLVRRRATRVRRAVSAAV